MVVPADVDLAAAYRTIEPRIEEADPVLLEAVKAATLEADRFPFGIQRLLSLGISTSFAVELDHDGATDRLLVVYGKVVDGDGRTKAMRRLMAVTTGAAPRAYIITELGESEMVPHANVVLEGGPPIVWISYVDLQSFCYAHHVLRLHEGALEDTLLFSICCPVTW